MIRAARTRAGNRMRPAGADGLKHLAARMRTGVAIATAFDIEARPWGARCTFLATVAEEPPTVMVTLRSDSPTAHAALTAGEFALNILPRGARTAAELFDSEAADAFERIDWTVPRGATGPHLRADAQVVANCAIMGHSCHGDKVTLFADVSHVFLKSLLRCGLLSAALAGAGLTV
ncbi:flavin reductase family protein [Streptomyces sp. NPDC001549]|uniref:flavin reductase family protein n=1 Tax=Streptomyces sp. NPDC001549 TaxID=3364586 RepID=UPI0036A5523D